MNSIAMVAHRDAAMYPARGTAATIRIRWTLLNAWSATTPGDAQARSPRSLPAGTDATRGD